MENVHRAGHRRILSEYEMVRYWTKGDIIIVAVLLFLSVASIAGVRTFYNGNRHVVVEVDGRHVLELSLDMNVTKNVDGPLGTTVVVIEKGTARIAESPCPNHTCIHMGRISRRGEIIVCVPNRVVVTISGGSDKDSFDGVLK